MRFLALRSEREEQEGGALFKSSDPRELRDLELQRGLVTLEGFLLGLLTFMVQFTTYWDGWQSRRMQRLEVPGTRSGPEGVENIHGFGSFPMGGVGVHIKREGAKGENPVPPKAPLPRAITNLITPIVVAVTALLCRLAVVARHSVMALHGRLATLFPDNGKTIREKETPWFDNSTVV
ncbi:hypothetical protein RRG08_030140 [Elysia crispata]|uniref:Uncharacterized protein n=1 Tax=Elysia crispata TaxID=231223 RepID=A0AAE1DLQ9_9GAST|nr:hypothetical protein RRG08_030140 [Elysia crispata]